MANQPLEANQVRLFIRNLLPTWRQHMRLIPFETFIALKNAGMLLEDELTREALTKTGGNRKGNYQNMDKKDNCP